MTSTKLRIGYGSSFPTFSHPCLTDTLPQTVPEHFSSPLLQLAARDPSLELVSCGSTSLPPLRLLPPANHLAGGTGQLISALKADKIDIAIALTEALITGIAKKTAEYKIVGTYVTSSLNWAVSVGKDSKYEKLADLRGEKMGISRIGR